MLLQETHFSSKYTETKREQVKKVFHANGNEKKDEIAILISDKIGFKLKTITREEKGHYIMVKESIQQDITVVNIYAPNIGN